MTGDNDNDENTNKGKKKNLITRNANERVKNQDQKANNGKITKEKENRLATCTNELAATFRLSRSTHSHAIY